MSTNTNAAQLAQEFIDNLRAMSTGSYLREEDKEFWEAPYPESAVDQAATSVNGLLEAALSASSETPTTDIDVLIPETADGKEEPSEKPTVASLSMIAQIQPYVDQLKQLSDRYFGELLDVEEIDELVAIVEALAKDNGAQATVVGGHVRAVCEA